MRELKKRVTPAGSYLPIQVLLVSKPCKTARSLCMVSYSTNKGATIGAVFLSELCQWSHLLDLYLFPSFRTEQNEYRKNFKSANHHRQGQNYF